MEIVYSFAIGDRVRYVGDDEHDLEHNPYGVITSSTTEVAGHLIYGYNLNAWYYHSDFELIERATPDSLQQVCELINAEYGDEDEEIPEEEEGE